MINLNGKLLPEDSPLFLETNRAFRYGDGLFETIRTLGSKISFWEDHYLRLMASMRILRMEIPMSFTMEFLESQIQDLLTSQPHAERGEACVETVGRSGAKRCVVA